jgi:hypothetical protein
VYTALQHRYAETPRFASGVLRLCLRRPARKRVGPTPEDVCLIAAALYERSALAFNFNCMASLRLRHIGSGIHGKSGAVNGKRFIWSAK